MFLGRKLLFCLERFLGDAGSERIPASAEHLIYWYETADRLAQLVEQRTAVREVAASNLDRTNTQGLSITDDKVLPFVMTSANG